VKAKDIKKNLKDVSGKLIRLPVSSEADIKGFVERNGYSYQIGSAFYQLSKDEKLQAHKRILVKEKGGKAVYTGDEARKLLGLPAATPYTEVKLRPMNLSTWEIFIASNSTNRKLVRGTNLMLLKAGETL
jgi:hypothetical protein